MALRTWVFARRHRTQLPATPSPKETVREPQTHPHRRRRPRHGRRRRRRRLRRPAATDQSPSTAGADAGTAAQQPAGRPPGSGRIAAALAEELGISEAKVQAALEKVMPQGGPRSGAAPDASRAAPDASSGA